MLKFRIDLRLFKGKIAQQLVYNFCMFNFYFLNTVWKIAWASQHQFSSTDAQKSQIQCTWTELLIMKKLLQTHRVNDAQLVFVIEHSQQLRESWGILYFFFFALLPSPKKSLKVLILTCVYNTEYQKCNRHEQKIPH